VRDRKKYPVSSHLTILVRYVPGPIYTLYSKFESEKKQKQRTGKTRYTSAARRRYEIVMRYNEGIHIFESNTTYMNEKIIKKKKKKRPEISH
jgi:hypothetical protein